MEASDDLRPDLRSAPLPALGPVLAQVVAAFEAILATADDAYRLGQTADFDFFAKGPSQELLTVAAVARG